MKAAPLRLGLVAALLLSTSVASASSKVPVSFDPKLGAKPARTQQKLAALEAKLPATFALSPSLTSVKMGALTLTFFPATVAQLQRAKSASGTMRWPTAAVLCPKHAAPNGLLPADFVPTLRSVLWKIRRGPIDA